MFISDVWLPTNLEYNVDIYIDIYVIVKIWVDTSDSRLLIPGWIILPVDFVSALTWFMRYVYYWYLQFLNNVIIIKIKILLPQTKTTLVHFGYHVYVLWLTWCQRFFLK
jgi:hypothetical protein